MEALFDLETLNATLFAGDLEGAIGMSEIGIYEIASDLLFGLGSYSVSGNVNFRLYADGNLIKTKTLNSPETIFRLPAGFRASRFYYEISGYAPVKEVTIATSVDELWR